MDKKNENIEQNNVEYSGNQYCFHSGWESEHLAAYLLSKFCFLGNPIKVGDDIGFDFFCTFFQNLDNSLIPQSSFIIQIKSNYNSIDLSKFNEKRTKMKSFVPMISEITVPFYIGVIDKSKQKLDIFTGFIIPEFLALKGPNYPNEGYESQIELIPKEFGECNHFYELYDASDTPNQIQILKFPKLCSFSINDSIEDLNKKKSEFMGHNLKFSRNILTRLMEEYTFDNPNGSPRRHVGVGSSRVFLHNYIRRTNELMASILYLDQIDGDFRNNNPILLGIYEELIKNFEKLIENPIIIPDQNIKINDKDIEDSKGLIINSRYFIRDWNKKIKKTN